MEAQHWRSSCQNTSEAVTRDWEGIKKKQQEKIMLIPNTWEALRGPLRLARNLRSLYSGADKMFSALNSYLIFVYSVL